ncbi:hypothetical protein T265_12054 [Opisthorchis viverrini]|uniref:Uncharacterized protein n=1 Tax=Opisthorchis viverrini TaxID=6198 RepID=A0A074ZUX8_OPIVI|nr:hypothetical protein T265_12054 [Opisthorchis viverrini]KER19014.1 hypothetical protein T265_12054 [Opisthorchis viverrini]
MLVARPPDGSVLGQNNNVNSMNKHNNNHINNYNNIDPCLDTCGRNEFNLVQAIFATNQAWVWFQICANPTRFLVLFVQVTACCRPDSMRSSVDSPHVWLFRPQHHAPKSGCQPCAPVRPTLNVLPCNDLSDPTYSKLGASASQLVRRHELDTCAATVYRRRIRLHGQIALHQPILFLFAVRLAYALVLPFFVCSTKLEYKCLHLIDLLFYHNSFSVNRPTCSEPISFQWRVYWKQILACTTTVP